jgi:hypothetical protein
LALAAMEEEILTINNTKKIVKELKAASALPVAA